MKAGNGDDANGVSSIGQIGKSKTPAGVRDGLRVAGNKRAAVVEIYVDGASDDNRLVRILNPVGVEVFVDGSVNGTKASANRDHIPHDRVSERNS